MILVTKKNDVYLHIDCDMSTGYELSDYFSFKVPNAHFHPKVKAKLWDGKIRLFSTWKHTLYVGLVHWLDKFAKDRGYEIFYADETLDPNKNSSRYDKDDVKKFIDTLDVHTKGKAIQPKEYQSSTLLEVFNKDRVLFVSPTGSGKSYNAYAMCRWWENILQGKKKILLVVPTTSLVEQMYSDFDDYASEVKWSSEKHCHRIYSGKEHTTKKPIILSTWQSLFRKPKSYFKQFGAVIIDECHLAKADSLKGIMEKLEDCVYKVGMTGTLDDCQTNKLVLEGLFGKVFKATTTKKLMDSGDLASLSVDCIILKYPEQECSACKKLKYQEEKDYIVAHKKRNKFVCDLSISLKTNTLVLYQLVEKHGRPLYESIKKKAGKNRKVFFVYGGTDAKDRESIRQIVETETNAIIVASYGTFSTGINIRNLSNIIFASPYKAKIKVLQSIGRGLRISKQKTTARLFDIVDDLRYKKHINYSMNHYLIRVGIYNKEQFKYKTIKIKL